MATSATKELRQNHIQRTRIAASKIVEGINELRTLKSEWDAGFNVWVVDASHDDTSDPEFNAGDFDGKNLGLRVIDITAVHGTTLAAIETLLADGHATNLQKIKM